MAYETIFSTPLGQLVLLFLLIFTLIFAILQKTEILGKGKRQIDALVALAIALLVSGVGSVLDFVQQIIPFLAIALVIILVFMLLLGMFYKEGTFDIPSWMKVTVGIIIFIALLIAVLIFTKGWDYIVGWFGGSSGWGGNVILIIVIIVAILIAFFGSGKSSGSGSSK